MRNLRHKRHKITGVRVWVSPRVAAFLFCAICVVIIGFYLFFWHMDQGFHRVFAASHTI